MKACICSLGMALSSRVAAGSARFACQYSRCQIFASQGCAPTMSALAHLAETREIVGLLVGLVGQTATQMSECAEQCGLSVVQASALLQIDGSMSMRELSARLGGPAPNPTRRRR